MSKVKTKRLKRLGIKTKKEVREARNYILTFHKCNKPYAYNNIAFSKSLLDSFSIFATTIKQQNKQNNEYNNRF